MKAGKVAFAMLLMSALIFAEPLLLIIDASGSMEDTLDSGVRKIDAAKSAATELVNSYSDEIALMVYTDCDSGGDPYSGSISVWVEFTTDKSELRNQISSLTPQSDTPIADSIEEGKTYIEDTKGYGKIVVLTDGEETCGSSSDIGDAIENAGIKQIDVSVIGYALDDYTDEELQEIVEDAGGKYYKAGDEEELKQAMKQASGDVGCCLFPVALVSLAGYMTYRKFN
ncbi:MAG: VWA domain-containing protein [Candidatus Micrarchaeota archaeon]